MALGDRERPRRAARAAPRRRSASATCLDERTWVHLSVVSHCTVNRRRPPMVPAPPRPPVQHDRDGDVSGRGRFTANCRQSRAADAPKTTRCPPCRPTVEPERRFASCRRRHRTRQSVRKRTRPAQPCYVTRSVLRPAPLVWHPAFASQFFPHRAYVSEGFSTRALRRPGKGRAIVIKRLRAYAVRRRRWSR